MQKRRGDEGEAESDSDILADEMGKQTLSRVLGLVVPSSSASLDSSSFAGGEKEAEEARPRHKARHTDGG